MRNRMFLLALGLTALTGCAGSGAFHPIHMDALIHPKISVVTSVEATLEDPVDVKDRFTAGERICVYSTFTWLGGSTTAPVEIKVKCYRDGSLVYIGRTLTRLDMCPWHVWFDLPPGLLGVGMYRADVCAGDAVLDSHTFEVTAS